MDPNTRGPEEYGHDGDTPRPRPRPPRDPLTSDFGQPALARTVQLVSGDFLLTVNPVDGSEIEVCPPAERPARPEKLTAAERAETARAALPPVPPGPTRTVLGLLAREDERERLVRLLARGRSVRLTGPGGSGRTSLLDVVAEDCAGLAPDGVVRLNGFHRTADDLLHDLFYAVHRAPLHRPGREELLGYLREVGAVVVLDDIEFGGTALDELLEATPECAFLIGATPDVPAPSADSAVEEVFLTGLDRSDGVELLERAAGRGLTEEEANWAGDLWFESEGLPLRFVQAGALLRRRDRLRAGADAVDEFGVFADARPADDDTPYDAAEAEADAGDASPLPSLGEAAAPAPLLASRLSASARATLEFAVALGGELPHQAHLPALVGDTHADAALGELADCGLVSPVGSRYRLAAGVLTQLESGGYTDGMGARALAAAQHYAWWTGHPSVTPERVCAEADAVLAALAVLVPTTTRTADDEESPAVQLARTAAPAFAAGLHWSAWERALRAGTEASRLAGDVAEQAYFHHELGVLALCEDQLDRARAELEASIGLRGALSDKHGAVAGRRALALVADRTGDTPAWAAARVPSAPSGPPPDSASSAQGSARRRGGGARRPARGVGVAVRGRPHALPAAPAASAVPDPGHQPRACRGAVPHGRQRHQGLRPAQPGGRRGGRAARRRARHGGDARRHLRERPGRPLQRGRRQPLGQPGHRRRRSRRGPAVRRRAGTGHHRPAERLRHAGRPDPLRVGAALAVAEQPGQHRRPRRRREPGRPGLAGHAHQVAQLADDEADLAEADGHRADGADAHGFRADLSGALRERDHLALGAGDVRHRRRSGDADEHGRLPGGAPSASQSSTGTGSGTGTPSGSEQTTEQII